jgi:hypothetical protein
MAEQKVLSLEQMLDLEEQKHDEITRKYLTENESVITIFSLNSLLN